MDFEERPLFRNATTRLAFDEVIHRHRAVCQQPVELIEAGPGGVRDGFQLKPFAAAALDRLGFDPKRLAVFFRQPFVQPVKPPDANFLHRFTRIKLAQPFIRLLDLELQALRIRPLRGDFSRDIFKAMK